MNPTIPPQQKFRFDQQLWNRFIAIAQPFFYPIEPGSTWIFAGLLILLLVTVVAVTFFVTVGLTIAGKLLFPGFFTNLASGLVQQVDGLVNSPVLYVAIGALVISVLIFIGQQRKLKQRWLQWGMLGVLLFLSFAVNGLNVAISYIFRSIDNALNEKDPAIFYQFLFIYTGIIVTAIPIIIAYIYIRRKLGLLWREWMTKNFLNRYFTNRSYYKLDSNAINTEIDNPDQRITADVESFTTTTLVFLLDILDSILTLLTFTLVLYTISKALTVGLLIYATFGTVVAVIAGGKLIKINYNQLRLEANFRYGMVHVRDNAESIAFYRGENLERQQVLSRLGEAIRNYDLLIIWESIITLFQRGYNYFTRIVPYLIVAPLYFVGKMDFGAIGQAYLAFFQVLDSLSIITNQIQSISAFGASVNRLGALDERLNDPEFGSTQTEAIATRTSTSETTEFVPVSNTDSPDREPVFAIQNLTLLTPNSEQQLFTNLSLELQPHDRLLVVGPSGCGKSSLLRAIAGLWTNGSGTINRPDNSEMLFLPQRPYMLLGNLRDQLIYPNVRNGIPDATILETLKLVNLEDLPDRLGGLEVEKDWPTVLSLGEQQRLAFARILLTKPKYVILDEATSALDVQNERNLYERLQNLDLVYISVGHRPSLLDYHQTVLELNPRSEWRVISAQDYRFALG
jgi:putative ATP-binding cassette transporter